jgi:hypothetical protein
MRKSKLLIILAIIIAIGVSIGLTTRHVVTKPVEMHVSEAVLEQAQSASMVDQTHVRFFSGSVFAEVDTNTGKTRALTHFYRLPNVSEVRWGQSGALIRVNSYTAVDQLYPILAQNSMDTSTSYWWHVDFASSAIQLVGSAAGISKAGTSILDVAWAKDGQTYYYLLAHEPSDTEIAPGSDATQLYQGTANGAESAVGPLPASVIASVTNTSILYQSSDNKHDVRSYELATKTSTVLFDKFIGSATFSDDASASLLITPQQQPKDGEEFSSDNTSGKLTLAKTGNPQANQLITDNFNGDTIWDGSAWLALTDDASGGFVNTQGGQKNFVFDGLPAGTSHLRLCGYQQNVLCVIDSNNSLFFASQSNVKPTSTRQPSLAQLQKGKLVVDQYRISYDTSADQYNIFIYRNNTANSAAALDYITSLGIDPYQLNSKWYTNSNEPLS